jgi:tRNA A-37 threonylcarbamoyl transferase component Bud32
MDGLLSVSAPPFAGRYTIERALGRGATAIVYLARETSTDRPVAIKVLRRELAETLGSKRFLQEIKLTQKLHHPRILSVLDSGEYDGQLYFVLPYMDGGTLRQRLVRDPQLPLAEAVKIVCTIAEALSHAHAQKLVHRDVKPENILFSGDEACLADFGIARAIERSIEDPSTSTGVIRGTPEYMSPEQASGAHDYDGRSDIYSLACVLYEMIAGMRAFMGPTTQAVIAQRFLHPPRELSIYRPNVSPKIESVIKHAMQVLPADRYGTASEFAQALCAIPVDELEIRPGPFRWPRMLQTLPRQIAAAGALLVVVGGVVLGGTRAWSSRGTTIAADTTRIVVLPLEGHSSARSAWRDDDLMHQALSRWRGLHVVDQFQVADGLRRGGPIQSVHSADAIARSLGAGRYIRGQLTPAGDGWRTRVALFDVGSNRPLYSVSDQIPNDFPAATLTYARLADSLLLRGASVGSSLGNQVGSRSLPAVQAFGRAQVALDEWDLSAADASFQAATVFDPEYARASLWLAQIRAWRSLPSATWTSLAERAVALPDQLSDRERHLGTALIQLGHENYARACEEYGRLRTRNDRDFAAWFGLGQCRMMDRIVVPDSTSPSKWRFRSSAAGAMTAYSMAFQILPSVHRGYERGAFESLRRLLLVSTDLRVGYCRQSLLSSGSCPSSSAPVLDGKSDSSIFYARPAWISDSLVLVPYPWHVLFAGDSSSIPSGFEAALARRRAEFRRIAAGWSAAFPQSAGAKHAVAISLDILGDPASIDTIRLARRLEPDSIRRFNLAAAEVILLTKFGVPDDLPRLRAARLLADSLLAGRLPESAAQAEALAPVAALSGRCAQTDALVHRMVPATGYENIPPQLIGDANALTARIAMGCQLGEISIRSVASTIERSYVRGKADQRRRVEQMLLYRPVLLAYRADRAVTVRFTASSQDNLLVGVNAVLQGDNSRARSALAAVDSRVDPVLPTPDLTLARALLWVDLSERSRASRVLDSMLETLRFADTKALSEPGNAASLVRAMIVRAELAWASGDRAAARRWAAAAGTLWSTDDRDLAPALEKLSQYGWVR